MSISLLNYTVATVAANSALSAKKAAEVSMERLSTGKRINSATDDAAGVAISSRLTAEIRGTNQSIRNALDGRALIDTAESAHKEVENILQRMREVSVNAANDTNSQADRNNMQKEIYALSKEIDRITSVSKWAGQNILSDTTTTFSLQVGTATVGPNQIKTTVGPMSTKGLLTGSGPGGFTINGISADDASGWSVSGAGDVNGDGLADLIVGAYGDDPNGIRSGTSTVVFGKRDGTAVELSAIESSSNAGGFVINGVSANDLSGHSVSGAGDVNGDGLADLIVGAYADDPNGNNSSGASTVVFGKADGTAVELSAIESSSNAGGFVINGVSALDYSGFVVSGAGDVNGDGLADLIIGAKFDDPNGEDSGASTVVFGKADGVAIELSAIELDSNSGGFVINGVSAGDKSGDYVSGAGDVNGDGLADLIIGSQTDGPNGNNSGASTVVFGKADGTAVELSAIESSVNARGFVINGVATNNYSGVSVSGAGDVNGDGLADLIVGADYDNPNGSQSGTSTVVFGKTDGTAVELSAIESSSNAGGFAIHGSLGDLSGYSVSGAGDVNGDGLSDLIIGAKADDPNGNSSGASTVVFGKADGTAVELSAIGSSSNSGGFVINGVSADDRSGRSVSGAGDVNGDGLADLIVGSYRDDPNGDGSGASHVLFGKANGTAVELSAIDTSTNQLRFVPVSVISGTAATSSIGRIDTALKNVNEQRSELGAVSNRLNQTVNSLTNISTNLSVARGGIEDADFALETAQLMKNQILGNIATAMLAQSNVQKQHIMGLLQS